MLYGVFSCLRPAGPADEPRYQVWKDFDLRRCHLLYPEEVFHPCPKGLVRSLFVRTRPRHQVYIIETMGLAGQSGGEAVGICGLCDIDARNREATFLIHIAKASYRRRGIGSEAAEILLDYGFRALSLAQVRALVHHENDPSIALHRRLGFREEESCPMKGGVLYSVDRDAWGMGRAIMAA